MTFLYHPAWQSLAPFLLFTHWQDATVRVLCRTGKQNAWELSHKNARHLEHLRRFGKTIESLLSVANITVCTADELYYVLSKEKASPYKLTLYSLFYIGRCNFRQSVWRRALVATTFFKEVSVCTWTPSRERGRSIISQTFSVSSMLILQRTFRSYSVQ